jgi:endoglucanase
MSALRAVLAIAVMGISVEARAPVTGDGYWQTSGNRILDAAGNEVRLSGVNFSGFESENFAFHGTWGGVGRSWTTYLDQMKALGFNVIRLPFSGDLLVPGQMPRNVDHQVNPELLGKTALEFLDLVVEEAGRRGIRIILDYHRIQAGSAPENGLWYVPGSATYTERRWIENWTALVSRYVGNPTVVGCDLFNEVHDGPGHPGPFWSADGVDEPYNWRTAAKRAAEAIHAVNPELLVFVQGMHAYGGEAGWWGANLRGLRDHPFDIQHRDRVVYSVHDYGPNVFDQPWHADPAFPGNLPAYWDAQWGFVHHEGIGPVWIGEWGSRLDDPREDAWAAALRDYIRANGLSWTWWTWGPQSHDTGGILRDDWTTTWPEKLELVAPVQYPPFAPSGPDAASDRGAERSGGCSTAADPRRRRPWSGAHSRMSKMRMAPESTTTAMTSPT